MLALCNYFKSHSHDFLLNDSRASMFLHNPLSILISAIFNPGYMLPVMRYGGRFNGVSCILLETKKNSPGECQSNHAIYFELSLLSALCFQKPSPNWLTNWHRNLLNAIHIENRFKVYSTFLPSFILSYHIFDIQQSSNVSNFLLLLFYKVFLLTFCKRFLPILSIHTCNKGIILTYFRGLFLWIMFHCFWMLFECSKALQKHLLSFSYSMGQNILSKGSILIFIVQIY